MTDQRMLAIGAAVTDLLAQPLSLPVVPHTAQLVDAHDRAVQSLRAHTTELLAALGRGRSTPR